MMRTANFNGRSVQIVVGYRNLSELTEKIKPFSYRCLKDDCLDLPDKTYMKRIVQLTDEQDKIYKQMKQQALATLNGKMLTTKNVVTQLMRLQQITSGHFTSDDGEIQIVKNNRIKELTNILDEISGS
jgi:SNF2 family DNA or RNA helicase